MPLLQPRVCHVISSASSCPQGPGADSPGTVGEEGRQSKLPGTGGHGIRQQELCSPRQARVQAGSTLANPGTSKPLPASVSTSVKWTWSFLRGEGPS